MAKIQIFCNYFIFCGGVKYSSISRLQESDGVVNRISAQPANHILMWTKTGESIVHQSHEMTEEGAPEGERVLNAKPLKPQGHTEGKRQAQA